MANIKTSLITTILNEEKDIEKFLDSVFHQSKLPDEIIIVDGGSSDSTVAKIKNEKLKMKNHKLKFKIFKKKSNRSVGRNAAIKRSAGDIILCSDVGCKLDKNWIKNISQPFINKKVDIVSGYYLPITKNIFEKCLASYTCVMPDKINQDTFLPSSRSIAFKKKVWKEIGGYPEYLNTCEDLMFARKLKEKKYRFEFAKEAIVYWPQRENLIQAFTQFYNYAIGDGMAYYFRKQTPFIFVRYLIGLFLLTLSIILKSRSIFYFTILLSLLYLIWSIWKNYKYINHKKAIFILPILQLLSDLGVILGMSVGMVRRVLNKSFMVIKS